MEIHYVKHIFFALLLSSSSFVVYGANKARKIRHLSYEEIKKKHDRSGGTMS